MEKALTKKVGELLAFSRYAETFFTDNAEALEEVWRKKDIQQAIESNASFAKALESVSKEKEVTKTADETMEKLESMESIYLENAEEAAELLEWLGFVEGAAAVHARLVSDMAKQGKLTDLAKKAKEIESFHDGMLEAIISTIGQAEES